MVRTMTGTVKALEWRKPSPKDTLTRAMTDLGIYRAYTYHEADGRWFWTLDGYIKVSGEGSTEQEVQAAAQADYESRIRSALTASASEPAPSFQQRVQPWMMACFGPEISADKLERADRFIEEALELVQSGGYPRERIAALTDYVYSREAGEPFQEVGGVEVTLAAYCLAHHLDMHQAGETELARIWTKVEKIRAKQAAKPTGSALPVANPVPTPDGAVTDAMVEAALKAQHDYHHSREISYEPDGMRAALSAALSHPSNGGAVGFEVAWSNWWKDIEPSRYSMKEGIASDAFRAGWEAAHPADGWREPFDNLSHIVQYRRYGTTRWTNMAAFDSERIAEKYRDDCADTNAPWEYRVTTAPEQIAPMFDDAPANVVLPDEFMMALGRALPSGEQPK